MKPRFTADYRLLFVTLGLLPAVPLMDLIEPMLVPWLVPFGLYLAYCTGIASHYHNHCPVFHARRANQLYSAWLSVFYGYPIFAWIPTHNQNHHKFTNGQGDLTRTSRYARQNTLWHALTYPFASAVYQAPSIGSYVRAAWREHPRRFAQICGQYVAIILVHAGFAVAAIALHGTSIGLLVYSLSMGLPASFAIWSMMFTNFIQHVDCDALSSNDHSRNFVHPTLNRFVFNSGYHTVHHEHPGVHWSHYEVLHASRANAIVAELNQSTMLGYCWSVYFAGPIHRRLKATRQCLRMVTRARLQRTAQPQQ